MKGSGLPSPGLNVRDGELDNDRMPYSADQLQHELARFNAALGQVPRLAGRGLDHDFERRLDAHRRMLSDMLDADGISVVMDTVAAAKSALTSPEPFHELRALARAQETLGKLVRRRATRLG